MSLGAEVRLHKEIREIILHFSHVQLLVKTFPVCVFGYDWSDRS